MIAEGTPDDDRAEGAGAEQDPKPDVKAAFREALAKKQAHQHAHNEGGEDAGRVHAHAAANTKRMFRRKSG